MTKEESKIEAALLGLFAAVKICRREGYDPHKLLELVEQKADEWGLLVEEAKEPK